MLFNIFAILALALSVSASPLFAREVTSSITSSGNDGAGNQEVGNNGQNSGNGVANKGRVGGDYTVEQAAQTCGNAQLNCCNKVEKMGDTTNAGLLGAVFGSGDVGVQCTPLNVPVLIARMDPLPLHAFEYNILTPHFLLLVQVPINKACDAKAACCQGDNTQVRRIVPTASAPLLDTNRAVLSYRMVWPILDVLRSHPSFNRPLLAHYSSNCVDGCWFGSLWV